MQLEITKRMATLKSVPQEFMEEVARTLEKEIVTGNVVDQQIGGMVEYDYCQGGKLKLFEGIHPAAMSERVRKQNWHFRYEQNKVQQPLKEKLLDLIEMRCGWRIGEFKNYRLI